MIIGTLRAMSYTVNFADLRKIDRTQFARFVNNSDILVVSVTIDNLPFIEKMAIPPEKLVLFQLNSSVDYYLSAFPHFYRSITNFDETKIFDEALSDVIKTIVGTSPQKKQIHRSIPSEFIVPNSTLHLHIGTGCDRKDRFCSLKNSTFSSLCETRDLLKTIERAFHKNCSLIRIKNHLGKSSRPLLLDIANYSLSQSSDSPFFSCHLIPEEYFDDIALFSILRKARFMQVEIDAMHTCPDILDYYGLSSNMSCLKTIIQNLINAGIPSIIINYVIGSPRETEQSLQHLLSDSLELYRISSSSLEFKLHFYYDENRKVLSDKEKGHQAKGFVRHTLIHDTSLSFDHIYAFRSHFYKLIMEEMRKALTIDIGLLHTTLSRKKIQTHHYVYYYSKSVVSQIYEFRNAGWMFWNEIKTKDVLNYVPTTFSTIYRTNNSPTQLTYDPLISRTNAPFFIDEDELYLFRLFAFSNQTIKRICQSLIRNNKAETMSDAIDKTIHFIERLDSITSILFRKNPLCET